jgi:hypothetical protein
MPQPPLLCEEGNEPTMNSVVIRSHLDTATTADEP